MKQDADISLPIFEGHKPSVGARVLGDDRTIHLVELMIGLYPAH